MELKRGYIVSFTDHSGYPNVVNYKHEVISDVKEGGKCIMSKGEYENWVNTVKDNVSNYCSDIKEGDDWNLLFVVTNTVTNKPSMIFISSIGENITKLSNELE